MKFTLLLVGRVWCEDANVPYRLMKSNLVADKLNMIPTGFFLSNVALSVLLKRDRSVRHGCIPIRFRERYGGEPSVELGRFGSKAAELIDQMASLPK